MTLLEIALSQYGLKEIPGEKDNPVIINFFAEIGHTWVQDDETAWCSAFINWCALKAGLKKSGKLNARSWLDFGDEITTPIPGDVVIFWRESPESWKGHVGLFVAERGKYIYCLGGNQKNMVRISGYNKAQLLGFRRLGPV